MTGRAERRLGFDSARFARSVQPETPERDQREIATSVPTPSPKLCHFRLTLTPEPRLLLLQSPKYLLLTGSTPAHCQH